MKKLFTLAIASLAMVSTVGAAEIVYDEAAEAKPAVSAQEQISEMIKGDMNGVIRIKKDANGEIKSLVVIGRAPIESTMDPAEAKMYAFDAAMSEARAQFVSWMKTQVTMVRTSSNNVAVYSKNDGTAQTRGSETTRLTQKQLVETAEGMVSGLEQIASATYENMYVIVLGWDAATVRAVAGMNDPKGGTTKGNPNGTIRIHVDPNAKRFL